MISASSAVRFRYRSALPAAIGATVAAERIATPELGPTFSWRLVPSSAYSKSPAHAAYSPRTGGTPASAAYAIACGTNTAQTASRGQRVPLHRQPPRRQPTGRRNRPDDRTADR